MATSEGQLSFYYISFNPTVCQSCAHILSKPVLMCYHLFSVLSANVIDTSPWEKKNLKVEISVSTQQAAIL